MAANIRGSNEPSSHAYMDKANNIEFEPIECHHTEPCLGTCLMCDYEVSYLDRKLQEKQGRGEKIELKGLMSGKDE